MRTWHTVDAHITQRPYTRHTEAAHEANTNHARIANKKHTPAPHATDAHTTHKITRTRYALRTEAAY